MLDKIKDFFGITGGNLIEIERQIEELKNQGKEEKYMLAELAYRKLENDMKWNYSDALQLETDNIELLKLDAIVQEGIQIDEVRRSKLIKLTEEKAKLEQEIVKLRKEKIRLETQPKGRFDDEIGNLECRIKTKLYEVQRDKLFILNKINALDDQIAETQYKHDLCTKTDMIKLELMVEIGQLRIQRDGIILSEYIPEQKKGEADLLQVEAWRKEIASLQTRNDSTKLQNVTNKLNGLIGGIE